MIDLLKKNQNFTVGKNQNKSFNCLLLNKSGQRYRNKKKADGFVDILSGCNLLSSNLRNWE